MTIVQDLLDAYTPKKAARGIWEDHWQQLAEVFLPNKATFRTRAVPGEKKTEDIYDSVPMLARRGLAAAFDGLMKPKTTKWLTPVASDHELNEDDTVRNWLSDTEERMFRAIYNRKAGFVSRSAEVDSELITFGTGALFTGESTDKNRLLFRSLPLQDLFVEKNSDGIIDTVFIRSKLTAKQAVHRYGEERVGSQTLEMSKATKQSDKKFEFIQVIRPRTERDVLRSDNLNMEFASLHLDVDSEHLIGEGGFPEFPLAIPQWETDPCEDFGRSPAMLALPDASTLQAMGKTLLVAGQKAADPPLWAAGDHLMSVVRTFPGGVTYVDSDAIREIGGAPVQPLNTGMNLPIGRDMQADVRDQIFAAFFRNVLNLPINSPSMTATEVLERKEEFVRTIGPVFGRLESDYLAPVAERVFGILSRNNLLAPPPEILQGREVDFEFASPTEKIRKQIEALGFSRSMELIGPIAAVQPEIFDNLDGDGMMRDMPDIFGWPDDWLRDKDEVLERRVARAEAQRRAEVIEQGDKIASLADSSVGQQLLPPPS